MLESELLPFTLHFAGLNENKQRLTAQKDQLNRYISTMPWPVLGSSTPNRA